MDLDRAQTHITAGHGRPRHIDMRLHGYRLVLARLVWLTLCVFSVGVFVASVPTYFAALHILCTGTLAFCRNTGLITPDDLQGFHSLGLSLDFFATYQTALYIVDAVVFSVVGAVIFWRKSDDRIAWLASLALVMIPQSTGSRLLAMLPSIWSLPGRLSIFMGTTFLFLLFYLFPTGRFAPRWTRWVCLIVTVLWAVNSLLPSFQILYPVALVGFLCSTLVAQIYRYRRVSTPLQRQQTKWVVFGGSIGAGAFLALEIFFTFFPSLLQGPLAHSITATAFYLDFLTIPLSFGIAMLRSHLFDIDRIINRTLVYGLLTAIVVGIYVLVVGGLGALLQARGNLIISLLATGLVAILFQPLRQRLQLAVNRLMYGERDTPYRVISRLGQRLEATLAPDEMLPTIGETVAQALKLPYAAITLKQEKGEVVTAASYGAPQAGLTRLPLLYHSEPLGELVLAPRGPGESFTSADRALLSDLARQAGAAAHAVRLTSDLQRLAADVQRSREQLVTAREEERRRLRRDLHDGLGPTLATITVKAEAASDAIAAEPAQARQLLEELIGQAQTAIGDIRRLVYNLRPPALDDLGLVAAIRAQALHYDHPGLHVSIVAPKPLPELSAAVEVAAYRIVQEALTNVVHHANARVCLIRLTCDGALHLEITDDGSGIAADRQAGVGLRSMKERAEEVGGTCVVEALPEGGTRVQASLPVSVEVARRAQSPASSSHEEAPVEE